MYTLKKIHGLVTQIIVLVQSVKHLLTDISKRIKRRKKGEVRISISSGHGSLVAGASDILDEVTEARRVVRKVASHLRRMGAEVEEFHDDTSSTQTTNIDTIVGWHNNQAPDQINVSVHFNAFEPTGKPRGTEVLFEDPNLWALASRLSLVISDAGGFRNRGSKHRFNLGFLNRIEGTAILIEVCFVDSVEDARLYNKKFGAICKAIAKALMAKDCR